MENHGWSEYGRLVLKELERLNEGQEQLRKELEDKFGELNTKITDFKNTESAVEELKRWREKVQEVWSVSQMKQGKDEIYEQKNKWAKVIGIVIAIQIIFGLIVAFKEQIF
jgi:hypothetical protein